MRRCNRLVTMSQSNNICCARYSRKLWPSYEDHIVCRRQLCWPGRALVHCPYAPAIRMPEADDMFVSHVSHPHPRPLTALAAGKFLGKGQAFFRQADRRLLASLLPPGFIIPGLAPLDCSLSSENEAIFEGKQ